MHWYKAPTRERDAEILQVIVRRVGVRRHGHSGESMRSLGRSHAGGSPIFGPRRWLPLQRPFVSEIAMGTSKIRPDRNFLDSSLFQ
jgi:hypothetical protein